MKVLACLAALLAGTAAAEYGITSYFFRRTMIRQNTDTGRTKDMAGTDWDQYMPYISECRTWLNDSPREDVYIKSEDGLRLHGTWFHGDPDASGRRKIILCFHGYTGKGMSDFTCMANFYLRHGYQVILVDQRAHGDSEGDYVGFGCLDRKDALRWIGFVLEQAGKDCGIWLHGLSMGAATVLMTSGLKLPAQVRGIISDCAFTSAWDVFSHVLKDQYHMPPYPILKLSDSMVKKRAGYGLKECSASEEVKKAKAPILMIHGEADTFVPVRMCREIYGNIASKKDILLVPGAGHAESFYKARSACEQKLTDFLAKTAE